MSHTDYKYSFPANEYRLPHGMKHETVILTKDEDAQKHAGAIIEAGFHFDFEYLRSGVLSLTCGDENGDYEHLLIFPTMSEEEGHDKMVEWVKELNVDRLKADAGLCASLEGDD